MHPVIIGGIIPALLVGTALSLLKAAGQGGIGAGTGMMIAGIGVFTAGLAAHLLGLSGTGSIRAVVSSLFVGLFWGSGTLLMLYAVSRLGLPMTVSASLAASNVLVVAAASILIFGEGDSLNTLKLICGVIAILIGSVLVTTA